MTEAVRIFANHVCSQRFLSEKEQLTGLVLNIQKKAEIHLPRRRDNAQQSIIDTSGLEIGSDRLSFTCQDLQYPKTVLRRFDANANRQCKSTEARCREPSQDRAHEKLDLSALRTNL